MYKMYGLVVLYFTFDDGWCDAQYDKCLLQSRVAGTILV